jgi:3D (Asp-Asp-Asp) domain-containing protein
MQFKKVAVLAMFFWLGGSFSKAVDVEAKEMRVSELKMTVTAYYKPLPNQKEYVLGSYEKDLRMNGSGEQTSSGAIPGQGTLAADQKIFSEGTVIHIPGYGEGVVEDIGGNINGMRLDLYMGKGDLGREKAVAWGKKNIKVRIVLRT